MKPFRILVLVLPVLSVPNLIGCGQSSAASVEDRKRNEPVASASNSGIAAIQDMDAQLTRQMVGRDAVEVSNGKLQNHGPIESARIVGFGKPGNPGELSISLDIKIARPGPDGSRVSLGRSVTMYRASPTHWVGTFGSPLRTAINLVLSFGPTRDDL